MEGEVGKGRERWRKKRRKGGRREGEGEESVLCGEKLRPGARPRAAVMDVLIVKMVGRRRYKASAVARKEKIRLKHGTRQRHGERMRAMAVAGSGNWQSESIHRVCIKFISIILTSTPPNIADRCAESNSNIK